MTNRLKWPQSIPASPIWDTSRNRVLCQWLTGLDLTSITNRTPSGLIFTETQLKTSLFRANTLRALTWITSKLMIIIQIQRISCWRTLLKKSTYHRSLKNFNRGIIRWSKGRTLSHRKSSSRLSLRRSNLMRLKKEKILARTIWWTPRISRESTATFSTTQKDTSRFILKCLIPQNWSRSTSTKCLQVNPTTGLKRLSEVRIWTLIEN